MTQGLLAVSVPLGPPATLSPVRTVFETSPGPILTVSSTPFSAPGGQPWTVPVFDYLNLSVPLSAPAGLSQVQILLPLPVVPAARPLRTWQRDVQKFAITQERERHVQALWQYGELSVFALLWAAVDEQTGFAQPCTRCNVAAGSVSPEQQISAAYGQGSQFRCPVCYGSQLVATATVKQFPGLRALLVRPALVSDIDKAQEFTPRGVVNQGAVNAESTPDFRVRNGDYMFRVGNFRYRLRTPRRTTLRTGFASPWQQTAAIAYNQMNAAIEDPTSVAYIIPPDAAALYEWLSTYTRVPVSYAGLEVINGPLIPEEAPPPSASGNLQPSVTFPLPVT
jgi:hypothetical protein